MGQAPARRGGELRETLSPAPVRWGAIAWTALAGLWVLGAAGVAAHVLVANARFARRLRSRRPLTDGPATALLDECRAISP